MMTKGTGNPPLSHPDFWPDRDSILTEDNLISVRGRREAELWPCAHNTSTDGESHDLEKKGAWFPRMCSCVCARGQRMAEDNGQQNIQ